MGKKNKRKRSIKNIFKSKQTNKKGNNENTKKVKVPKNKQNKKVDNDNGKTKLVKVPKNKKEKKNHKILKLILKIFLVVFVLIVLAVAGIVAGFFFGLFGDDFKITKEDLVIGASNSTVLDKNGNIIAVLSGDEKREIVTLADMPSYLPEAFISIEHNS